MDANKVNLSGIATPLIVFSAFWVWVKTFSQPYLFFGLGCVYSVICIYYVMASHRAEEEKEGVAPDKVLLFIIFGCTWTFFCHLWKWSTYTTLPFLVWLMVLFLISLAIGFFSYWCHERLDRRAELLRGDKEITLAAYYAKRSDFYLAVSRTFFTLLGGIILILCFIK